MAEIKAGTVNTVDNTAVAVHIINRTERGKFVSVLTIGGQSARLDHDGARELAAVLQDSADKGEILDAAIGG